MEVGARNSDDEQEAFLEKDDHATTSTQHAARKRVAWTQHLRILIEIAMAATIVLLLITRRSAIKTSEFSNTIVPEFPKKIYTFTYNPHYAHKDMFLNESLTLHILHNWIPLSSAARGYIRLPAHHASDPSLPPPTTINYDRFTTGPGYMVSVFHQLHCLSYFAEHFQQGYAGVPLTEEVAHHAAHCLNYLRQGIMCAADTTLEGRTEMGPGEGSRHVCRDYGEVLRWADEWAGERWREGLLPGESIL